MAKDDHSKAMPPAFAKFFADALPNDGGNHTLCLGEAHSDTEHLELLTDQLESLHKNQNVQTIGLERPTFYNVFLWAYRDGKLTELLGSKEAARNYVKNIFTAEKKQKTTIQQHVLLALNALDLGMEAVCYDSRDMLNESLNESQRQVSKCLENKRLSTEQTQRLHQFMDEHAYLLEGVSTILEHYPEYAENLSTIEQLIEIGHKKINEGKLTSDALSAAVFNAIAGEGNRLTIGGISHIDGLGGMKMDTRFYMLPPDKEHVHGTFGHHLFAAGQPQREHHVTGAVIATVASKKEKHDDTTLQSYALNPHNRSLAGHRVPWLNLDDGTIGKLWHPEDDNPNDPRIVPLEEKFPKLPWYRFPSPSTKAAHTAAHINPLLMPEIKTAYDAVREVLHGKDVDPPTR